METQTETQNELEGKRTIRTFAFASFLNDFGSDMVHSLWPMFLTQVLGVNMAVLGLIDGMGEALVSISQAVSGYWSDRIRNRKIFIWLGYLMGGTARLGYAVFRTWPAVLIFKILDRSGKMRDAPRDAMAADVSNHGNRGKNFGIMEAMDHFGAVCGILASIILIHYLSIRSIFLLSGIPTLFGALLIYVFIKEKKHEGKLFQGLKWRDLNFEFKWFLVLSSLFAVASFSYSFLMIFAKNSGFGIATIPVLYLIYMVTASASSYPFGNLADRIGRKAVILSGFILWGITVGTMIFSQTAEAIYVAFIFFGLSKGAVGAAQKTYVSELCPVDYRASAIGTFRMVTGLAALPASLMAGILWESIGMFIPFYASLALTVVASVMLIFVKKT